MNIFEGIPEKLKIIEDIIISDNEHCNLNCPHYVDNYDDYYDTGEPVCLLDIENDGLEADLEGRVMRTEFCIKKGIKAGEISDGYHTFDELYEHRYYLWIALVKMLMTINNATAYKFKHYEGYFVLGIEIPIGGRIKQISYHLPIKLWDLINIPEKGWIFDGHTSNDVLKTLQELVDKIY
ncbi:hypothetical protein [Caudoviricetes sp.]|nr:hypothetical protein [Caudoviricetes sp.]